MFLGMQFSLLEEAVGPDWMATARGVWLAKMKAAYQPEQMLEVSSPTLHTCTGVLCVRPKTVEFWALGYVSVMVD